MRPFFLWLVCIADQLSREVRSNKHNIKANSQSDEHGANLDGSEFISDHSFIALIDIVFTDGSKRICTGAIVDDTVVITAAHCFSMQADPHVAPELTLSFVVIGTRKMFDTGYEQYLPIERVLTHPDYHGWKADLSLVFTFAAMTADKPGTVIHLAGDKIIDRLDTNITVISWGGSNQLPSTISAWQKKHPETTIETTKTSKKPCSGSDSNSREEEDKKSKEKVVGRAGKVKRFRDKNSDHDDDDDRELQHSPYSKHGRDRKRDHEINVYNYGSTNVEHVSVTTALSRYLDDSRKDTVKTKFHKRSRDHSTPDSASSSSSSSSRESNEVSTTTTSTATKKHRQKSWFDNIPDMNEENLDKYIDAIYEKARSASSGRKVDFKKLSRHKRDLNTQTESTGTENKNFKSYYKNWRRSMGTQQNNIFVEEFTMIKLSQCKRLLERAVSSSYDISEGNDFVCYTSDEHYISEHDSGAPAIKRHRLVAITLGGFECDGERVALGMKMSCYCSWIASNIPNGKNFTCCTDCCNEKNQNQRWLV